MNRTRLLIAWSILAVIALAAANTVMRERTQALQTLAAAHAQTDANQLNRQAANDYVAEVFERLDNNARWQLPAADITVDTCALESHFERSVVLTGQDRQFYRAVEAMCRAKFSQDDAAYTAARATALSSIPK